MNAGALTRRAGASGTVGPAALLLRSRNIPRAGTGISEDDVTMEPAKRRAAQQPRELWPRERIIAALKGWAQRYGAAPAAANWKRAGSDHPSATTVCTRFGSWSAALVVAELERWPARRWHAQQIVELLQADARRLGRTPTQTEFCVGADRPSPGTVARLCGSWPETLARAGLRRAARPRRWSPQRIVALLQDDARRRGRTPTTKEFCAGVDRPLVATVRRQCGSWPVLVERAGLEPSKRSQIWPAERVIAGLKAWAVEHGHASLATEWKRSDADHPSVMLVCRRFGSWPAALTAADLPLNTRPAREWASPAVLSVLRGRAAAWTSTNARGMGPGWYSTRHRGRRTDLWHLGGRTATGRRRLRDGPSRRVRDRGVAPRRRPPGLL